MSEPRKKLSAAARAKLLERNRRQNADPEFIAKRTAGIARYLAKLKSANSTAQPSPMSEIAPKSIPTPAELLTLASSMPAKHEPPVLTVLDGGPDAVAHESQDAETISAEPAPTTSTAPDSSPAAGDETAPTGPRIINVNEEKLHRIRWTPAEIKIVALRIAELAHKAGWRHLPDLDDRGSRILVHDMLSAAQVLLPADRRRLAAPFQSFREDIWKEVEIALTAKSYLKTETVPIVILPPGATDARLGRGFNPAPTAPETPAAARVQAVGELPTATLLSETFSRLLAMVGASEAQERKIKTLENDFNERLAELENRLKTAPVTAPEKKKRPLVAVLGCDDQMMEHLRTACTHAGIEVEFRHYHNDSNPKPVHADRALSFRFVDHRWHDQLKISFPDKNHRQFVPGGIGMAVQVIKAWFPSAGA